MHQPKISHFFDGLRLNSAKILAMIRAQCMFSTSKSNVLKHKDLGPDKKKLYLGPIRFETHYNNIR